jgi:hypothetical protein
MYSCTSMYKGMVQDKAIPQYWLKWNRKNIKSYGNGWKKRRDDSVDGMIENYEIIEGTAW